MSTDIATVKRDAGNALQAIQQHEAALEAEEAALKELLQQRPDIADRIDKIAHHKSVVSRSKKNYNQQLVTLRSLGLQAHQETPDQRKYEDGLIEIQPVNNSVIHWDEDEAWLVAKKIERHNKALARTVYNINQDGFIELKKSTTLAHLVPDTVLTLGATYKASIRQGKQRLIEFASEDEPTVSTFKWSDMDGLTQTSGPRHTPDDLQLAAEFEMWAQRAPTSEEAYILNCLRRDAWKSSVGYIPFDSFKTPVKFLVSQVVHADLDQMRMPNAKELLHMMGKPLPAAVEHGNMKDAIATLSAIEPAMQEAE